MPLAQNSKRLSTPEFLKWTDSLDSSQRFELLAGEPIAMSPERNRHNLVKTACWQAINNAVKNSEQNCTVLGDGASIVISDEDVYEPDITVQCGQPVDLDATTVPFPCLVVEVLSPSTKGIDAGGKLFGYFQVPSIAHYLMIDPVNKVIIHHYREQDSVQTKIITAGFVSIDSLGIGFSLDDCFGSLR